MDFVENACFEADNKETRREERGEDEAVLHGNECASPPDKIKRDDDEHDVHGGV